MNAPARPEDGPSSGEAPDDDQSEVSGLRDPKRAIAALGGIILGLEALVLLLAIVPLRMMGVRHLGAAITLVLIMVVAAIVLAGMCRHDWAWWAGVGLQTAVLVSGLFFHWALLGVGVIFGATWLFALSVRGKLSRPPKR
ncbi:MAG TPA: DUF4233 domain-containing protein [Stackebrandtia sp.]|jgi:hypothetical protein|uniref:DUF4233 domain-containing protein n=1 Tax=Stackebrandtia sp. TaxID=2023065 RepID=UPI002D383103|nr:DUF4233 domain-containing protein [Stackebrandtia sp.]HZE39893.1 DUF4233 domain-containing protein [Stackebrandtia sp.]